MCTADYTCLGMLCQMLTTVAACFHVERDLRDEANNSSSRGYRNNIGNLNMGNFKLLFDINCLSDLFISLGGEFSHYPTKFKCHWCVKESYQFLSQGSKPQRSRPSSVKVPV